jgi:hypothetical protein
MAQGTTYNRGRCPVVCLDGTRCTKWISNAGFALAAHNKMHARKGELVGLTKFNWKGEAMETATVTPTQYENQKSKYNRNGFFRTFEECKTFNGWGE